MFQMALTVLNTFWSFSLISLPQYLAIVCLDVASHSVVFSLLINVYAHAQSFFM